MMKESIDLPGKIITNILIALYEPFGFSLLLSFLAMFYRKIKPKSDYPLKTLYPRAFQTGQNHLIYYDFTTVE